MKLENSSPIPQVLESGIGWTRWTWNPWAGCIHVSPGCDYCYANRDFARWGKDFSQVKRTTDAVWKKPYRMSKQLALEYPGVPVSMIPLSSRLVFTCSLSDVFIKEADPWRDDFWQVIRDNPGLIFQILTKRPSRIKSHLPPDWGDGYPNVWIGVTCENQEWAERRLPILAEVPAAVRFVSFEPLLGYINLLGAKLEDVTWKKNHYPQIGGGIGVNFMWKSYAFDWAIIGGESGHDKEDSPYKYRPCDVEWIRSLIEQSRRIQAAVFVKQLGTHLHHKLGTSRHSADHVGEWPEHIRVQELPFGRLSC